MPTENVKPITLTSKQLLRLELQEDIKAFLASGNKIQQCHHTASAYEDHTREFMKRNYTRAERKLREKRERENASNT